MRSGLSRYGATASSRTYGHFQETPALYETKDKKGSLVNFDFSSGLYTVPKELDNGYLEIGKKKVEFHCVEGKE